MSSDDNLHQFCYKISMNEQAVAPFIESENIYMEEVGFKGNRKVLWQNGAWFPLVNQMQNSSP